MLAIRILQEQGAQVEALNFRTTFTCCQETAAQAAHQLGVKHTVLAQEDDYLDVIRRPRYGYGRGANPCVDCRIYMFRKAQAYMQDVGADCVISGEVLGQRPMSQKRRDLDTIAHESGLEDRLLRPLSALRLPATQVERDRVVDRRRLYGFVGRSRKPLIALARQFGFSNIPSPSTGCALTEPQYAVKVHDLIQLDPANNAWDLPAEHGRHVRFVAQLRSSSPARAKPLSRSPLPPSPALGLAHSDGLGPSALVCGPSTQPRSTAADCCVATARSLADEPALVHTPHEKHFLPPPITPLRQELPPTNGSGGSGCYWFYKRFVTRGDE